MSIKNVGKGLGRWAAVCGLVLGGLCLAGCRTQSPEQQFAEVPPGLTTTSAAGTALAAAVAPAAARTGHSPRSDSRFQASGGSGRDQQRRS